MTDHLGSMFSAQRKLQTTLLGIDPQHMDRGDLLRYITDMATACTGELHEALDETGWKPWTTSDHLNIEAFRDELTDAWLFLLNLMLAAGMTSKDLFNRYHEKRANNEKLFQEKYDGVTTKCPVCKRAYDNKAVECYPAIPACHIPGMESPETPAWCSRQATMETTTPPDGPHCPQCRTAYGPDIRCHPSSTQGFGWCDKFRQTLLTVDGQTITLDGGERVA